MPNMSYCRFQNTLGDLRDCKRALEEIMYEEGDPLSNDEYHACCHMIDVCVELIADLCDETGHELSLNTNGTSIVTALSKRLKRD